MHALDYLGDFPLAAGYQGYHAGSYVDDSTGTQLHQCCCWIKTEQIWAEIQESLLEFIIFCFKYLNVSAFPRCTILWVLQNTSLPTGYLRVAGTWWGGKGGRDGETWEATFLWAVASSFICKISEEDPFVARVPPDNKYTSCNKYTRCFTK